MKKIFSFLSVALLAMSLSAETVTLTMSEFTAAPFTSRGITVSATDGTQTPTAFTGTEMRVYAGGTLTVSTSVNHITAIEFGLSDKGKQRLAEITSDVEGVSIVDAQSVSWAGNATSITFTVGDQATHGTDGSKKAGQLDFLTLTITTDGEQPADPEPATENITFVGGEIDAEYAEFGFADLMLFTFTEWSEPDEEGYVNPVGDGIMLQLSLYIGDYTDLSGTYSIADESIDADYSYMVSIAGTDTTELTFTSAELTLKLVSRETSEIAGYVASTYEVSFTGKASNGVVYTTNQTIEFDTYEPIEEAIDQVKDNADNAKSAKFLRNGQVLILRGNTLYTPAGAAVSTINTPATVSPTR